MSRRNDRAALADMRAHAVEAMELFENATPDELESDRRTILALLHLVQIVGEAATRVTTAIRDAHPEVPWTDVIGMRNHLVHGYDDADLNLLHSTIATDLPALVAQLAAILGDES